MSGDGRGPTPRVSVITTTYRTPPPLLDLAIDSVLRQTMPDLELVLVADGPLGDEQRRVVDAYDDPRLVVLEPGRVGRPRALNAGIAHARGDLIAIQDADDASHVERLERQVRALDRSPELALVGSDVRRTEGRASPDWALPPPAPAIEVLDRKLLLGNPLVHSSVLIRRSAVEAVGGYAPDRRYQVDHDLYLRLRDAGMRLGRIRAPLVMKRVHDDQTFESSPLMPRLVSAWRLQVEHARREPAPARYALVGAASFRLAARAIRGSARRAGARRRQTGSRRAPLAAPRPGPSC